LRRLFVRLGAFVKRSRDEQRLKEEIEEHLARQTEANVNAGLTPEEARRQAVLKFGAIEAFKDQYRDERGIPFLEHLWQDIRYALRGLRKNPGFTTIALITLALGIGATTAIFTVVNAVLLQPFPYAEPERLVLIRTNGIDGRPEPLLNGAEIHDLRAATNVFDQVAAVVAVVGSITGEQEMERVTTANVTGNFFATLGAAPALGRPLDERVDVATNAILSVVISDELWQRRYQRDARIIGRRIELNNLPVTIVGVMPRGFKLLLNGDTQVPAQIDVWLTTGPERDRRQRSRTVIARLARGVTVDSARGAMTALSAHLNAAHRDAYARVPLQFSVQPLQDDTVDDVRSSLLALMGAVGCVLLIACANVANLVIARLAGRQGEIAVRCAIGASRGRLVQQLMTEGLVVGVLGGLAGLLVARWTGLVLVWLRPSSLPPVNATVDAATVLFGIGISFIAVVLFSMSPVSYAARIDVADIVNRTRGGRVSSRRISSFLVIGQVALSVVLLVGAGLMLRTIVALYSVRTGFEATDVLTMQAQMSPREFAQPEKRWQFYKAVVEQLSALPGVQSVSAIRPLPFEKTVFSNRFSDRFLRLGSDTELTASWHTTLPGYFKTMGVRLIEGRDFEALDMEQRRPVVIVDEHFARHAWPGQSAVGQQLWRAVPKAIAMEVIGVVGHVRAKSLRDEDGPQVYFPYHRQALFDLAVVMKVAGNPLQLAGASRSAVESIGGKRPVYDVRPMSDYIEDVTRETRFVLMLLSMFAGLAVLLAAIGIYGVISQGVAQSTHELGIRLALGSSRLEVVRLVLVRAGAVTAAGITLGIAGAMVMTQYIRTMLFGLTSLDPATYVGVTVIFGVVALVASYLPARRAARVDPLVALRCD
jgi:predicted permease